MTEPNRFDLYPIQGRGETEPASDTPVAHVVAIFDAADGSTALLVLCPFCGGRHQVKTDGFEQPGVRHPRCKPKLSYRIGAVPDDRAMEAVRRARRAVGWMLGHPWAAQCSASKVERIIAAAAEFEQRIAAVADEQGEFRQ